MKSFVFVFLFLVRRVFNIKIDSIRSFGNEICIYLLFTKKNVFVDIGMNRLVYFIYCENLIFFFYIVVAVRWN